MKHATDLSVAVLDEDAFGDRFDLNQLPLARPGTGYAIQKLDTDTLLDRRTCNFLPVRDPALDGLYDSFDAAFFAAANWILENRVSLEEQPLAIVPAFFDQDLQRHVLIYGVLTRSP